MRYDELSNIVNITVEKYHLSEPFVHNQSLVNIKILILTSSSFCSFLYCHPFDLRRRFFKIKQTGKARQVFGGYDLDERRLRVLQCCIATAEMTIIYRIILYFYEVDATPANAGRGEFCYGVDSAFLVLCFASFGPLVLDLSLSLEVKSLIS